VAEASRIVTANKPKSKPYTGPAARDEDTDATATEPRPCIRAEALAAPLRRFRHGVSHGMRVERAAAADRAEWSRGRVFPAH
jgi:hypothetical protein